MKQTKNTAFRKVLSVVLTVVMAFGYLGLFSGLLNLNPTAEAAEAGGYRVKVEASVTNGTKSDAFENAYIKIKYATNNGQGGEVWTDNLVPGTPDIWYGSDDGTWSCGFDTTLPGFPVELEGYANCQSYGFMSLSTDALTIHMYSISVWNNNTGSWTVLWKGDIKLDTSKIWKKGWVNAGGTDWSRESSLGDAVECSTEINNWANSTPYAAAVEVTGTDTINVPLSGTATGSYSAIVKDQYGVAWNADPTGWVFAQHSGINGAASSNTAATLTVSNEANTSATDYTYAVTAKYGDTLSGTKNVTIHPHAYTVHYMSPDGATEYAAREVGYGQSDTYAPDASALNGWTFVGWSANQNPESAELGVTVGSVTGDRTVYARLSKTLSATFRHMDGDATMEATVYNGNTSASVSAPGTDKVPATAVKDGKTYTLTGWATSDATAADISTGYTTGSTYYAVYSVPAVLQYDANKGANAPDDGSAAIAANYNGTAFNGSFTVSNSEPTRAGYTFLGWSADRNATAAEIAKGSTLTTDALTKTIYAIWSANTDTAFAVNYYLQNSDGTYAKEKTVAAAGTTDTAVTLNDYKETKTGFTFEKFTLGDSTDATEAATATIAGDGSLVINVYYTRDKFAVTVPEGTGYTVNTTGGDVYYQDPFSFELTLAEGYTQTRPNVTANGVALTAAPKAGAENTYVYTVASVEAATTVLIDGLKLNAYKVTLPATDTGAWTAESATGFNADSVTHGDDYSFTVKVNRAYSQTVPAVTYDDETIAAASVADNADGSKTYTYVRENVVADGEVAVAAMEKNTYKVELPSGEGYATVAAAGVDLNRVVDGTDLHFSVVLEEQYNRSAYRVLRNGVELTPDDAGVYTVNVTKDILLPEIEVKDVELNHYYIALALDTEIGYTIEVMAGYNPKATLSGTDFKFQLFLDPAYDQSVPVVKLSEDGGATYNEMTATDDIYTIDRVLSDCIVLVENVTINKYTVVFNDANGDALETYTDVPYGTGVSYQGAEPTKAEDILDSNTVTTTEGGVTTTVTTETVRSYTFTGWSADTAKVTADITADPIFSAQEFIRTTTTVGEDEPTIEEGEKTDATVTVLFLDYNAATLYKAAVVKGQSFTGYAGATPERASSNPHAAYTFAGWDKDGDSVADILAGESTAMANLTEDVTLVAVYEYSLGTRPVQFYSYDGSLLLDSANVNLGEKAVYGKNGIPSRRDDVYEYDFAGWAFEKDADETGVVEDLTVPAAADGEEETIKLYAAYSRTPIEYSYRFVNDGVVLQEATFKLVDGINEYFYEGATPERASTASTDYAFSGWLVAQSSHNVTFTAMYDESVHPYAVSLTAGDGLTADGAAATEYGATYTFTVTTDKRTSKQTPVVTDALGNTLTATGRTGDDVNGYVYTYEIAVTGDTIAEVEQKLTITAEATVNTYLIVFRNDNGDELFTQELSYGEMPAYDGATPAKDADEQYTYTFKGWTPDLAPATADAVYTASYDSDVNSYTVKFVNYDGTVLDEQVLAYGATPVYGGLLPERSDDPAVTYTFAGWTPAIDAVTGDVTYMAQFDETVNTYTVKFVNFDGSLLKTVTVAYGETPVYGAVAPTRPETDKSTFVFAGWTPAIKAATADATYTATYTETAKEKLTCWQRLINFFKMLINMFKTIC